MVQFSPAPPQSSGQVLLLISVRPVSGPRDDKCNSKNCVKKSVKSKNYSLKNGGEGGPPPKNKLKNPKT